MASHSFAATTAARLPFLITAAVGNRFLSIAPAQIIVEPKVAGRSIRAYSIPGSLISQLQRVLPVTLSGIPGIGWDVPMTLNWLMGLSGGSPVTVKPSSDVMPVHLVGSGCASWPVTGIFK